MSLAHSAWSAVSHGLFRKEEFRYDAGSDTYLCPAGQRLEPRYHWEVKGHALVNYCNPGACRTCPLKPRCTPNTHRRISRWADEAVLDRMAERLAARPEILRVRRETVEHPFGSIKQWMNQGYFLMRGLEKVRAEFSLTALAYNFTRTVNLVGIPKMLAAL
jgi:transposase